MLELMYMYVGVGHEHCTKTRCPATNPTHECTGKGLMDGRACQHRALEVITTKINPTFPWKAVIVYIIWKHSNYRYMSKFTPPAVCSTITIHYGHTSMYMDVKAACTVSRTNSQYCEE